VLVLLAFSFISHVDQALQRRVVLMAPTEPQQADRTASAILPTTAGCLRLSDYDSLSPAHVTSSASHILCRDSQGSFCDLTNNNSRLFEAQ